LAVNKLISNFIILLSCILYSTITSAHINSSWHQLKTSYGKPQHQWPSIETTDGRVVKQLSPLTLLKPQPLPARVKLGRQLFHDTLLSRDNTVSCSSCHEARMLFGDLRSKPIGIDLQQGDRNTPNIFGIDHWQSFFWDGRAKTAEEQALMPIENPLEMGSSVELVLERINLEPHYNLLIKNAFSTNNINRQQLADALVAFERTIIPKQTIYGNFISTAQFSPQVAVELLTEKQLRGLHLYRTKAKCMTCHNGPLLSDNQFHVTGLHAFGRRIEDLGRYQHTKKPSDVGKFRTPSLVMVTHTKPWMHHGLFVNLGGIINFYNRGGARPKQRKGQKNNPLFPTTTNLLKPLQLSKQEREALLEFLQIL